MPELFWRYLTVLLYYRTSASCVALAEALQTVSHERLTSYCKLNGPGTHLWSWPFAHCSSGNEAISSSCIPESAANARKPARSRTPARLYSYDTLLEWLSQDPGTPGRGAMAGS